MKKVIYLNFLRLPTEKANGYQIVKTCEALAKQGVTVELWNVKRHQPDNLRNIDPFKYYNVKPNFSIRWLNGLDIQNYIPQSRFAQQNFRWPLMATALPNLVWQLRKVWNSADTLLFTRDFYIAWLLCSLHNKFQAPLVLEAHGLPENKPRPYMMRSFHKLDGFIGITAQIRRLYLEQTRIEPTHAYVVHDAVDLAKFKLGETQRVYRERMGLPLDRPIVGYIGRFQTSGQEKGVPTLIRSLQGVAARPLLLCVGGPLERVPQYRAIAQSVGLSADDVRFVDRVPNADVPIWIKCCDIVTIPSPFTDHFAYFSSPLKLFEYMAAGVPIIASDLPAICEVLQHDKNAYIVAPDSADALRTGLECLLTNPALRERLADQARQDVCEYTWSRRAEKILAAYPCVA